MKYGPDPLQSTKIFRWVDGPECIVFVHGGAWVYPHNTYDDWATMAEQFIKCRHLNHFSLASINYRLSPAVKHPEHLRDVIAALRQLRERGIEKVHLVGHSVGATLVFQLLNEDIAGERLDLSIASMFLLEGIYSVRQLLKDHPEYEEMFVRKALDSYAITPLDDPYASKPIEQRRYVVVHSCRDELVPLQVEQLGAYFALHGVHYSTHTDDYGLHDEVFASGCVGEIITGYLAPAQGP